MGELPPQCTLEGGQQGRLRARAATHRCQVGRRVSLCPSRTAQRNEGAEGCREGEPLADGSSWAYRGAGVGFGSSLLREMSVLNPGGSRG